MHRRQNPEFVNRRNSNRPPSPPSADVSVHSSHTDSSVQPSHASSNSGSRRTQNSRIMSKSAQKKSDCVSLSEDLAEHGSNMSDVKSLSYCMEDLSLTSNSPIERDKAGKIAGDITGKSSPITSSNMKEIRYGKAHQDNESSQNSRIMSKSAQKKSDRVSLLEDLIEHGSNMSDVKSLSYRMKDLSLTSNSPVERDKAGKIESGDITVKSSPITSSKIKEIRHGEAHQDNESSQKEMGVSAGSDTSGWYDICPPKKGSGVVLKTPLLQKNRERRNENKRNMEGNTILILRPGMILLKKFLSLSDQVKLVKTCRELGMDPGGFYQPGYRDGALLNLKMMCLGKNWDPEKGYDDIRPIDGTKPPLIPNEFSQLVERALNDSHAHLKEKHKKRNVEDILPPMSPNICIVNFYTKSSRLGLHQDKDESSQSLVKELPVVSFSVGESAEFLYGDQRDVNQADKAILESGDVLIFGGKARHIYHGVSAILPNTAPPSLLEETNLRPGRLNLTFREY